MRNKSLLLTFASLFALVGCNSGGGEITPKNITLNVNSLTLDVNEEYTLKATVTPENAKYDGISWKSSNQNYVSVNNGVVKALVGDKQATITAYIDLNKNNAPDENEPNATCSVSVNPVIATDVTLNRTELTLTQNQEFTLVATVTPSTATYKVVSWTSSQEENVVVNSNGVVKALKENSTSTITAFVDLNKNNVLDENEPNATCEVTVKQNVIPTGLTLSPKSLTLDVDEEATLVASVTPNDATYASITWVSSDPDNVSVNNGVVKGLVGESTSTITAYIDLNSNKTLDQGEPNDTASVSVNKAARQNKIKIEITDIKKAAYLYSIGVDLDESVPNEKLRLAAKKLSYEYDYYSSIASWNNGEDLKNKLEALLNDESFTPLKYNSNWLPNQNADESEENIDNVYLLYSQNEDLKTHTKSSGVGWDREHLFCASLLTGKNTSEATKNPGIATDFHNLYASHTDGNNSRGNKNMGFVDINDPDTNIKTDDYISNPTTFMPTSSEDQGIASRSIFYMATKYATSDGIYLREATCSSGDKCHGNLSTMLEWNKNDVTRHELKHNEQVAELQHNRNPYVDFPELVDYVFGDKKDQAGTLLSLTPSVVKLGIQDHENEHYKYALGDVKIKYRIGETYSKNDLNVYEINKGFTKAKYTGSFTSSIADGTEFNELGTTNVNISIGNELIGTYTLEVVDTDFVAECEYNHYFNYTNDFKNSGAAPDTPDARAITNFTFSGVDWKLTREAGKINGQGSGELGTQFGTSTASCKKITLESKGDFSYLGLDIIKAIYFEGNCASQESITVNFYLNDELLKTQVITRPKNTGNIHYLVGVTL